MAAATRARSAPHKSIFSVAPTPTVFSVYQGRFYPPAGRGVGPGKLFIGDPQAVLRRHGGGLHAHCRLRQLHRGLRLRNTQPGGLHGRGVLQRAVDQHIELGITIAFPPAAVQSAVRQVDHLRQLGLLRVDQRPWPGSS
jgi:hypothetical protein